MEYRVTWTIEVEADNPRDAAVKAHNAQTRPDTTATVFEVQERHQVRAELAAPVVEVDLAEDYDADQEGAPVTLTMRREGDHTYTRI